MGGKDRTQIFGITRLADTVHSSRFTADSRIGGPLTATSPSATTAAPSHDRPEHVALGAGRRAHRSRSGASCSGQRWQLALLRAATAEETAEDGRRHRHRLLLLLLRLRQRQQTSQRSGSSPTTMTPTPRTRRSSCPRHRSWRLTTASTPCCDVDVPWPVCTPSVATLLPVSSCTALWAVSCGLPKLGKDGDQNTS